MQFTQSFLWSMCVVLFINSLGCFLYKNSIDPNYRGLFKIDQIHDSLPNRRFSVIRHYICSDNAYFKAKGTLLIISYSYFTSEYVYLVTDITSDQYDKHELWDDDTLILSSIKKYNGQEILESTDLSREYYIRKMANTDLRITMVNVRTSKEYTGSIKAVHDSFSYVL